jgi:hypothetical protein
VGRRYTAVSDPKLWSRIDDILWAKLSQAGPAMGLIFDSVSTAFLLMLWEDGQLVPRIEGGSDGVEKEFGVLLPEEETEIRSLGAFGLDPPISLQEPLAFPAAWAEWLLDAVSVRVLGSRLNRLMESWTTPWAEYDAYEPGAELGEPATEVPETGAPEFVRVLLAQGLIELDERADVDRVAESLELLLQRIEDTHETASRIIERLVGDPHVLEVFASADQLAPLLAEW